MAIVHDGLVVAAGPTDVVRNGRSLEQTFIEAVGATATGVEHLDWLRGDAIMGEPVRA